MTERSNMRISTEHVEITISVEGDLQRFTDGGELDTALIRSLIEEAATHWWIKDDPDAFFRFLATILTAVARHAAPGEVPLEAPLPAYMMLEDVIRWLREDGYLNEIVGPSTESSADEDLLLDP